MVLLTIALMAGFTFLITKTDLGRAQRACEQDKTMASLLGINVDRTISVTFIIGSSLASVAGMILTTECALTDIKEDTPAGPPMGGGGMPGMM